MSLYRYSTEFKIRLYLLHLLLIQDDIHTKDFVTQYLNEVEYDAVDGQVVAKKEKKVDEMMMMMMMMMKKKKKKKKKMMMKMMIL